MPNWCKNRLIVEGTKEDVLSFAKHVSGPNGSVDFEKAMPIPANVTNPTDIRDWCQENWGTQWTPHCDPALRDNYELIKAFRYGVFFDTAWTPPVKFVIGVSIVFPELSFDLRYYDSILIYAGHIQVKSGDIINKYQYDDEDYDNHDEEMIIFIRENFDPSFCENELARIKLVKQKEIHLMKNINISYVNVDKTTINAFDIPIGTAFTGQIGDYTNKLFLRMYEGVVALDDPRATWTCNKETNSPTVKNYREVHLEIFVKPVEVVEPTEDIDLED